MGLGLETGLAHASDPRVVCSQASSGLGSGTADSSVGPCSPAPLPGQDNLLLRRQPSTAWEQKLGNERPVSCPLMEVTSFTPSKSAGTASSDPKTHTHVGFPPSFLFPGNPAPVDHLHRHPHFRLGEWQATLGCRERNGLKNTALGKSQIKEPSSPTEAKRKLSRGSS